MPELRRFRSRKEKNRKKQKETERNRKKQKEMEHWLQHIRNVFSGDERYMIQNAYYQEQGYRPFYALKGTLSLLLQVPFFMSAYHDMEV